MINILFVITRLAVGGAPKSLLATIRGLDRTRYRIVLVTGQPNPDEGSLMDLAATLNVKLCVQPHLQRDIHPIREVKAFWQLYRFIRRGRYEIVHTHLSKAGILGRLAARFAGVSRIVHTYHGDVFDAYFSPIKSQLLLAAERIVGLATDRFVVVSEALQKRYLGYRVGRSNTYSVVPNGVSSEKLPDRGSGTGNRKRVGTVAMLYPIKRVDLFLDVARRVLRHHPEVEFIVVGGGPEEATLREAARGLEDRIRFLGIRLDVFELLSTLDVFVLSSDYEGAGIGLMEAMLVGVPVVATRVGGVPEIVSEGVTGLLVPKGDGDALALAVLRLLEDADLCERMGRAARELAPKRFSTEKMVESLDSVYSDLANLRRANWSSSLAPQAT